VVLTCLRARCWNARVVIRRAVTWLATVGVAIVVAVAVPGSQLRAVTIIQSCCCPDPTRCHCPDHEADPSGPPTIRPCHNTERELAGAQLPAFGPPAIAGAITPVIAVVALAHELPAPHPAPPPSRPDAPS
jgi:hypothetical protein